MTDREPSGTWAPLPDARNPAWDEASRGVDLSRPLPYATGETFAIGDVITHPKFGIGIVVGLKEGNKMYVAFRDDTRRLVHGLK